MVSKPPKYPIPPNSYDLRSNKGFSGQVINLNFTSLVNHLENKQNQEDRESQEYVYDLWLRFF
jgi:hypothetical protein